jgi:hypothetical protein
MPTRGRYDANPDGRRRMTNGAVADLRRTTTG